MGDRDLLLGDCDLLFGDLRFGDLDFCLGEAVLFLPGGDFLRLSTDLDLDACFCFRGTGSGEEDGDRAGLRLDLGGGDSLSFFFFTTLAATETVLLGSLSEDSSRLDFPVLSSSDDSDSEVSLALPFLGGEALFCSSFICFLEANASRRNLSVSDSSVFSSESRDFLALLSLISPSSEDDASPRRLANGGDW